MDNNLQNFVGRIFRLKKQLGPLQPGDEVYCFAYENGSVWLSLSKEWCGTHQVKLSEIVFKTFV